MRRRTLIRSLLLIVTLGGAVGSVEATKVRDDVTFEGTIAHSDLAVAGIVGKKLDSVWRGGKHRTVYTRYEVEITDVLSGELPESGSIVLLTKGAFLVEAIENGAVQPSPLLSIF